MHRRSLSVAVVVFGLAVSALFSYLAVRNVDFGRFKDGLADSDYRWLVPAVAVLALGILLRALRWRLLFEPETRPPLRATTKALMIGYFFNNVLPARPGEAIRVLTLHQDAGTSRAEAMGTAVAERVYDVLALLVLFFVWLPWLPHVTWLRRAAIVTISFVCVLAVVIAVLVRWRERPLRWLFRPLVLLPGLSSERTERAAENVVLGLVAMRRARIAIPALAVTFVAILVITFSFWLVMLALKLELGFGASVLVMVTTNLAFLVPSSPAAVGVFEAATLVALRAYGVGDSHALSYAVVLHGLNFFPFVAVGLLLLYRQSQVWRSRAT
jgi:glycosyltransferase 2 family protein